MPRVGIMPGQRQADEESLELQNVDSLSTMMEEKAAIPVSAKARAPVSDEHE